MFINRKENDRQLIENLGFDFRFFIESPLMKTSLSMALESSKGRYDYFTQSTVIGLPAILLAVVL